jgi:Carboxypeptidase regulatory-like domain
LDACAGSICSNSANDAGKSPTVIMRRPHIVLLLSLIALGSVPAYGAAPGTISGVVRDSQGVAQIGATVQLLRPDLTVIDSVFTDSKGRYNLSFVLPGRYAVKAMGTSFLPSLREDIRLRSSAVVNLTLNTLYEVMQWLPSEPRAGDSQQDDWKWTLRAAANRPLLRWLEDGPLVVVSDRSGRSPRLKARLLATGQQGSFGESGDRLSATLEETPANSRELLAQVDFDPDSNAGMESMLGFRQDLGFAGSVESVAAVSIHPGIDAGGSEGLDEAAFRTEEAIQLGDSLDAEVGSSQVLARFTQNSPNTVVAALPFANVAWHSGDSTIHYRIATALPAAQGLDESQAQAWLPALSMRDGKLAMEHGLHQEIGWERRTGSSNVAVLVFADNISNPMMEAMSRFSAAGPGAQAGQLLFDPASGLVRVAGPSLSTAGMEASVERRLPKRCQIRASYANGDALRLTASTQQAGQGIGMAQLLASARPRHAQTYSISLSGTLDGTGTHWRATYRWQPEDTVTSVAAFSQNAASPYMNIQMRQPIGFRRNNEGGNGFEAMINVNNLLTQGYRPYVLSDGSVLIFAQGQRSFSGGLAFNF